MSDAPSLWDYLPTTVLLSIFEYLDSKDLLNAGLVCKKWCELSRDSLLWKELFYIDFNVDRNVNIAPGLDKSWYDEYKRLIYHIPIAQTENLIEHHHQVLHVSFSHNGKYFATTSKDGYVIVWNSAFPATIKYCKDMKAYAWKYTQFSQFNESDTLLLVSGVHFGSSYCTSGEIAVFSLEDDFELKCRVLNKPYDIFGAWYSDQYLLSGNLHWLAHLVSTSVLWVNKASQEINSEHIPVTHHLYKFYNRNASSIRDIMVANCLPNSENAEGVSEKSDTGSNAKDGNVEEHGNPVSHRDINLPSVSNEVRVPMTSRHVMHKTANGFEYVSPFRYNEEYRRVEKERNERHMRRLFDQNYPEEADSDSELDWIIKMDSSDFEELEQEVKNDKFLIFTTGFKTYTPHQIGIKRMKPFNFPKRMVQGLSLSERILLREQREAQRPPEPNWLDFDSVAHKFDPVDHVIDLHGHIIGMGLSPDHRYLYVNTRPWPYNYIIKNPLDPPPIAQEIDIHVIDLVTLKRVGTMLRAHKAYTPNNECFFIFLDVCEEYVASGAEDKHGYLWDRHYGICLAKFPHSDVVNSVAFNPKDPEMLVTTSDDNTIKVWRSRATVYEKLNTNMVELLKRGALPLGLEVRNERRKAHHHRQGNRQRYND